MKTTGKNIHLSNNYLLSFGYFKASVFVYRNNEKIPVKYIWGLLLGIIFFTSVSAKPEELATKYSIHMSGVNVGEFSVTQTNDNEVVYIEAITDIKVNLLFSYRIKYVQNTIYKQGVLQNSHIKTYKNGKLNSNMRIKFENGLYLLVTDGDTAIFNDSITYSGSLLYFNEPKAIKRIYKERSAEMRNITPVSEHIYIIKDKKGRELNRYYYEDGILKYATLRNALGSLELKQILIKETND
ncbi:MAG TPA: DUF6134 family protein [Bacteroidales bacterium]|nr:DUF6134 family protein [Bacteroidales bacterium]